MSLEILRIDATNPRATLVLCHGAWHGAWCWHDGFAQRLADQGISTLAPSLRGHAGSAAGKRLNKLRIKDYVADLTSVITSVDGPVHVAGHSMGGFIIQRFLSAVDRPEMASATLLAPVPHYSPWGTALTLARRDPRAFAAANLTLDLHHAVNTDDRVRFAFFTERTPADVVQKTATRLQSESFLAYLDMMGLGLPKPRPIDEPLLVVGAGDDPLIGAKDVAATAKAWNSILKTVDGIGHDLMLDTGWEQTADIVADWVLTH